MNHLKITRKGRSLDVTLKLYNSTMKESPLNRHIVLTQGTVTLKVPRESDAPYLAKYINNKKIWDNLRDYIPFPYTEEDAENFILSVGTENPPLTFVIRYEDQICGVIGLVALTDVYRRSASIGYWVAEPFWGQGVASKALALATNYGLNQLGYIRLHTSVFEYNPASMRVLEKNGYIKEGIFKKAIFKNEQLWDEHRYAILRVVDS